MLPATVGGWYDAASLGCIPAFSVCRRRQKEELRRTVAILFLQDLALK
jgi:deoxyxylulose-5-phosphate synthase